MRWVHHIWHFLLWVLTPIPRVRSLFTLSHPSLMPLLHLIFTFFDSPRKAHKHHLDLDTTCLLKMELPWLTFEWTLNSRCVGTNEAWIWPREQGIKTLYVPVRVYTCDCVDTRVYPLGRRGQSRWGVVNSERWSAWAHEDCIFSQSIAIILD